MNLSQFLKGYIMSGTFSDSALRIRDRVMSFTGNTKIRDHLIQEGKIAVYVEKKMKMVNSLLKKIKQES